MKIERPSMNTGDQVTDLVAYQENLRIDQELRGALMGSWRAGDADAVADALVGLYYSGPDIQDDADEERYRSPEAVGRLIDRNLRSKRRFLGEEVAPRPPYEEFVGKVAAAITGVFHES